MGKNYSLILLKPESPCDETEVLQVMGIENPVLNQTSKGGLPRHSPGEMAIGKMGNCWLVHAEKLLGESAIAADATEIERTLAAAFPQGMVLFLGNFESAAVFWFLLLEDGKRRRLKANVREENLSFGQPLPEETAFYKSVRTVEEGIEVYDWWTDKAAGQTTEYTVDQVGGTLGEAIFDRILGAENPSEHFSEVEYRAFLDASEIEALRHQTWKTSASRRIDQVFHRWIPRPDFDHWFLEKAVPLFESAGFAYLPESGNFSMQLPLCQLFITLQNPVHHSGAASFAKTQLVFGAGLQSEPMGRWLAAREQYEYDHPMSCGHLQGLNLTTRDRQINAGKAGNRPISLEEIFGLFEGFLREVALPAVRWCAEPKNLLCCLEERFRLPFLSLQNLPEPAVHLFRAEFERSKKQLDGHDFRRPFGNFQFFGECYASASDEEQRELGRLTFSLKGIDYQRNTCPDYASAVSALEAFAAAYWALFFPKTPPPVLDLPRRDVLHPVRPLPFDLTEKPPIVVGEDAAVPVELSEPKRGFFRRVFGWFGGSKPKRESFSEQIETSFISAVLYARSNVSLVLGLRKGKPVSGVKEFVDKRLGHFPEFHQVENRFWAISIYGKADPEMAFPLLEQNTFEELDPDRHGDEIRRGLDWLLSWSTEHFGNRLHGQVLQRAMAQLLKNPAAPHFYNLRDFLSRTADGCAQSGAFPASVRLECHVLSLFFGFARSLETLVNNGSPSDFIAFQNSLPKHLAQMKNLPGCSPEAGTRLETRVRSVFSDDLPQRLGLDRVQLSPEVCRRDFGFSESDFAKPIDFQIALARAARLRREMREKLAAAHFYPTLAAEAAGLAEDLKRDF